MNRDGAIARAAAYFDSGAFSRDLARRVACPTESQNAACAAELRAYLDDQIVPALAALGLSTRIVANPISGAPPLLIGERIESPSLATVLMYGHGDVVRGQDDHWSEGLSPWTVTQRGDQLYGRGTADNKGQHSINLGALAAVLAERGGRLGFNLKWLFEMGEEAGSPGLRRTARRRERDALAADVLIASDGPRLRADRPTLFLGSRGVANFDLVCRLRDGAHHSGNWGGLLRNPATVLAAAIASLVDGRGRILVAGLRPPPIPDAVRAALAEIEVGGGAGDPRIDADWGEPGLTPAERVFGWNTLEVLALRGRQRRAAGQRDPARGARALPAALRRRHRLAAAARARAGASRRAWPVDGRGRRTGDDGGDAPRSRFAVGALGAGVDRAHDRRAGRRCCPTSAARCPTTSSPTRSACRRCGCRTPIPPARSTRPTSTCSRPSRARRCRSWPGCSGISATARRSRGDWPERSGCSGFAAHCTRADRYKIAWAIGRCGAFSGCWRWRRASACGWWQHAAGDAGAGRGRGGGDRRGGGLRGAGERDDRPSPSAATGLVQIAANGSVTPLNTVEIRAQVSAVVTKVAHPRGAVRQGRRAAVLARRARRRGQPGQGAGAARARSRGACRRAAPARAQPRPAGPEVRLAERRRREPDARRDAAGGRQRRPRGDRRGQGRPRLQPHRRAVGGARRRDQRLRRQPGAAEFAAAGDDHPARPDRGRLHAAAA